MNVRFTKKERNEKRLYYEEQQAKSTDPINKKKQYFLAQFIGWYSIDKAGHVAYFDTNSEQLGKIPCCYFQLPFNDYFCAYKFTVEVFVNNRRRFHPEWCYYFTPVDGIFVYELEDKNGKSVKGHNYIRTIIPDIPKMLADFPEEITKALSFTRYNGFYNDEELIKIEDLNFYRNPIWCACPETLKEPEKPDLEFENMTH